MAKWRQSQFKNQNATTTAGQKESNNRVSKWRYNQKQLQENVTEASEQLMSQKAIERYEIDYFLLYTF